MVLFPVRLDDAVLTPRLDEAHQLLDEISNMLTEMRLKHAVAVK
jgi:hypothetical protein